MAMNETAMRNWGVAAAAGALGIATLVALQGEPKPSGAPSQPPASVTGPVTPGATTTGDEKSINPISNDAANTLAPPNPASGKTGGNDPAKATGKPTVTTEAADIGEAINPNLEFIVRFGSQSAFGKAQTQYQAGDLSGAQQAARQALASTPSLTGLCLQRFTIGGEIVLAHCARVPQTQIKVVSDRWARRLRNLRDVEYADPNVILQTEKPQQRIQ